MEEKEFEKLLTITVDEPICIESYMCLKEESINGPYGEWGWNVSLKNIQNHFLYVFVLGTIIQYNELQKLNIIRSDIVMKILNYDSLLDAQLSEEESKFYEMWNKASVDCEYNLLKRNSIKICKYLSSLGYIMNFILYKDPKKALSKALELDKYLPQDEPGFGEFLRSNLYDEYE